MKSETQPVVEQLPAPRLKRSINPWVLIIGAAFGFLVLIAVGLSLLALFAPQQALRENERRLPDGSVLRVEGVTFSSTDRFEIKHTSPVPWAFLERPRTPTLAHGSVPPQLAVWMTRHDSRSGKSLDFDWWAGNTAINALGESVADQNAFHREFGIHGDSTNSGNRPFRADRSRFDTWLVSSSFPMFRTDHGRFKLQVQNTSGEIVATFELTHPFPLSIQDWKADELPITKNSGDVAVTLQRLHPSLSWITSDGVKRRKWDFSPETTVTQDGNPSKNWEIVLQEVTDPPGDHWPGSNYLSTREPVWKVKLGACRTSNTQFTAAETGTFLDLPLPMKNTAKSLTDSRTIDDVTVALLTIAAAGNTNYTLATPSLSRYGNTNWTDINSVFDFPAKYEFNTSGSSNSVKVEANWPHLVWEVAGRTPFHRVYVNAQDDRGRVVPTQQRTAFQETLGITFFKIEPDAKSLTLSIIVYHNREFEFFIKPPELPTDKPKP